MPSFLPGLIEWLQHQGLPASVPVALGIVSNELKASEARQVKRIEELRADMKESFPDGMPAPPATPPVTVNISMQPSPTRGVDGQPSKPATVSPHPP